ncbi:MULTISPECIES: hypothetical protein [unclassified Ensifer]|uniref:hypothetical protein n=1 Tax=unclassified Ensifer TaxID=2633371 RepID=UPI000812D128|nr:MULTISPECIES: hypothetical protein [unclassified Ensifer]OCP17435.1 hypothetical protein BC361_08230 [Ensifer sp. LC54]OCP28659.1 hypothetical protein BC363_02125 [Ensifer sp. LC384]
MSRKTTPPKNDLPLTEEREDATSYAVTALAPGRVAGQRATEGDVLRLTEEEARNELLSGHIRPVTADGVKAD